MDGLGERIQVCRAVLHAEGASGGSQAGFGQALAIKMGLSKPVSGATVSRWESGEFEPDLSTLVAIARLSGVDAGWLAFGEYSQAPDPKKTLGSKASDAARAVIESDAARRKEKLESKARLLGHLRAVNKAIAIAKPKE